jgi:hypothetical protein
MVAIAPKASAQVCHEGRIEGSTIHWRSSFFADESFVGALPRGAFESIEGGVVREEDREIVGIGVTRMGANPVVLSTRQVISGDTVTLRPPLVSSPQRIVLVSNRGASIAFAPELGGPITRHVGYHASRGIDDYTRAELDRWCPERERGVPIYVRDIDPEQLRGEIVRSEERGDSLLRVGWLVLALGAVGAFFGYRRLTARAQIEHADALIEGRFRALERQEKKDTESR